MALGVPFRDGMVRALACVFVIIATACAPQQPRAPATSAPADPIAQAEQRIARGEFEAAAGGLASAAATAGEPAATRYRLSAALIEADLGRAGALDAVAAATPPDDTAARAMHGLALAVQSAASGARSEAQAALEALPTAPLTSHQRGLYLRTLGELQLAHGDPLAASTNLIQAERYPMPAGRRTELTHVLWSALSASDRAALDPVLVAGDANAPGWLALLDAVRSQSHDPVALASALADWQLRHPGHPAQEILIEALIEEAQEEARGPRRIALLLPLDGPLAGPAAAIRDGFLAMHFALGRGAPEPVVTIHSTDGGDVRAIAAEAVAAGADLIVGPLEKQAVQQLRTSGELGAAVLALNTIEDAAGSANPRFYQFGLRPEDEAVDLAERAWADGLRRMSAYVPNTELGSRVLRAFRERWQSLGGTLLSEARYVGEADSYAAAVQQTLGLAESERRAASLRALLRRQLVSEPRRRPDLDGVMLAAYPVDARQIMPQFRYFDAGDLTVYATSQVFSGRVDPSGDQDLNGVVFGEMPWLLRQRDDELRRIVATYWQPSAANLRFFAFGADARRLVPYLARMRAEPGLKLTGATGDLAMDAAGVVHRKLTWAQFRDGAPRLRQAAPALPAGAAP